MRVGLPDGTGIEVSDLGSGRPVVLVPGRPGVRWMWGPFPETLAGRGLRVVSYDRPGHGESDPPAQPHGYRIESNARSLLALVGILGLERPTLVGWSAGGPIAQAAAALATDRVSGWVAVASHDAIWARRTSPVVAFSRRHPLLLRGLSRVGPLARRIVASRLVAAYAPGPVPPGAATRMLVEARTGSVDRTLAAEFRAGPVAPGALPPLRVPTLVIHGEADAAFRPALARTLAEGIPGAVLELIPDAGHMLPVTHADILADRIAAFVGVEDAP